MVTYWFAVHVALLVSVQSVLSFSCSGSGDDDLPGDDGLANVCFLEIIILPPHAQQW